MAKPWRCRLGMHRWKREWDERGQHYRHCARCGKDDDTSSRILRMGGAP